MPGITGFIRPSAPPNAGRDLESMLGAMRHKEFYVANYYVNHESGVYLGWCAQPGSVGAKMPIMSKDDRYALILVGEHYPSDQSFELSDARANREQWATRFFRTFEASAQDALDSLNGWFSGIVVDLVSKKVTLFNDRYGMGRVYWHESEGEFIFGSEAKSLLLVRPQLRSLSPESLAELLKFNCVLGNRTLFKDISLLPGGSSWVFQGSSVPQKARYFDFSKWEQQPLLPIGAFYEEFDRIVSRIVPQYVTGSNAPGVSLTAGLDTRLILAALQKEMREIPCYTFGGMWGETFDIRTARKLSKMCGTTHEIIRIDDAFLREFGSYAEKSVFISDGCHDMLGAHDVYFNDIARQIAPVRITGKFGSEIVRTRRLIPNGDFYRQGAKPELFRALAEARLEKKNGTHPLTPVVADEIAWFESGRVSIEQTATIMRTPYMDNELVRLMYQGGPEIRGSRDLQASFVMTKNEALAGVPTNMGKVWPGREALSSVTFLPYRILFKIEYIYLYSMPHWLARIDRSLSRFKLEQIVTGRQKFEGYRIWMRTHLADYIRDVLLSPSARVTEFFDKKWINQVVTGHLEGTHNYIFEINKLMTLELICSSLLGIGNPNNAARESSSPLRKQVSPEVLPVHSN